MKFCEALHKLDQPMYLCQAQPKNYQKYSNSIQSIIKRVKILKNEKPKNTEIPGFSSLKYSQKLVIRNSTRIE